MGRFARAYLTAMALAAAFTASPPEAAAQMLPGATGSVIRPGALKDIPQHLTELGWDTDLPSLFVIRFQPSATNSDTAWSSWALAEFLQRGGFMARPRVNPWPPIFVGNGAWSCAAANCRHRTCRRSNPGTCAAASCRRRTCRCSNPGACAARRSFRRSSSIPRPSSPRRLSARPPSFFRLASGRDCRKRVRWPSALAFPRPSDWR